jgi:hypothetical protein
MTIFIVNSVHVHSMHILALPLLLLCLHTTRHSPVCKTNALTTLNLFLNVSVHSRGAPRNLNRNCRCVHSNTKTIWLLERIALLRTRLELCVSVMISTNWPSTRFRTMMLWKTFLKNCNVFWKCGNLTKFSF